MSSIIFVFAETQIHVNQVGYELTGPKRAVVQSESRLSQTTAYVIDQSGTVVDSFPLEEGNRVLQWRDGRIFSGIDFTSFERAGTYTLRVGTVESPAFKIAERMLFEETSYDALVTFFNAYRCKNEDMKDIDIFGTNQTHNLYGGWFDASGDAGKHLSHLSFSNYFNPQQIPMVVWSILHAVELYEDHFGAAGKEEAAWGADYLLRSLSSTGYFYMSAFDNWGIGPSHSDQEDNPWWEICEWSGVTGKRSDGYQCGMRQGGGVSIAALARTAAAGISGDSSAAAYLEGAKRAYAHLKENPTAYLNDGEWNILDDYTALLAATELYNATDEEQYRADAAEYAASLLGRQTTQGWFYSDDARKRPFYHAAEEGLVPISLIRYAQVTNPSDIAQIRESVRKNLLWYKEITSSTHNPFGYVKMYRNPENGSGPVDGDLARGKTASASSVEGSFTADKAVNGVTSGNENRWSSDFNDDEWFQVDLGESFQIDKVIIVWEAAFGKQYKIQVSENGDSWSDIVEVTNGTGGTDQHTFDPVSGRYVRMQGIERGYEWGGYSIFSFQVFGETADDSSETASGEPFFFIAHENETGYWWQGQNARLSSMSAAMAMGSVFADPSGELWKEHFFEMSVNQLNWILGNNPFHLSMMTGFGENVYPDYYVVVDALNGGHAKGGICNGITAKRGTISYDNPDDDFKASNPNDLEYMTGEDFGDEQWRSWRWVEQWLPHNAWYVIAVTSLTYNIDNPSVSVRRAGIAPARQQFAMRVKNVSSVRVTLELGRALDEATPFAIYDIKGRKVFSTMLTEGTRSTVLSIPKALPSGTYTLSLEHRSSPVTLRSVMIR
ncbi:MAG: discoidin domain-containing protein [Chitinispirillaceae bacterium]